MYIPAFPFVEPLDASRDLQYCTGGSFLFFLFVIITDMVSFMFFPGPRHPFAFSITRYAQFVLIIFSIEHTSKCKSSPPATGKYANYVHEAREYL